MRLIDADALLKDINDYPYGYRGMIKDTIARQPTVDIDAITERHEEIGYDKGFRDGYAEALEVTDDAIKHGHWIRSSDGYWEECSKCHASIDISMGSGLYNADGNEVEHDWCPNCGAKMDVVENAKG